MIIYSSNTINNTINNDDSKPILNQHRRNSCIPPDEKPGKCRQDHDANEASPWSTIFQNQEALDSVDHCW